MYTEGIQYMPVSCIHWGDTIHTLALCILRGYNTCLCLVYTKEIQYIPCLMYTEGIQYTSLPYVYWGDTMNTHALCILRGYNTPPVLCILRDTIHTHDLCIMRGYNTPPLLCILRGYNTHPCVMYTEGIQYTPCLMYSEGIQYILLPCAHWGDTIHIPVLHTLRRYIIHVHDTQLYQTYFRRPYCEFNPEPSLTHFI